MNRSSSRKINKDTLVLNNALDQMGLIDIYRRFHPKAAEYLNQDIGVEGRALTPCWKNTRITTSCWIIINRKTLELTKKDIPHPKTKEKPQ